MRYVFGEYTLDMQRYELRRAGQRVPLEPKAFDLLAYLVRHRTRVVGRTELLEQVWPHQFISDHSLTARLRAVRQALGDEARKPHVIATVHGRGYRFIASLTTAPASELPHESRQPAGSSGRSMVVAAGPMVERASDLASLHRYLDRVREGRRQVIFVTGEAGLGKTTLVDTFVHEAGRSGPLGIGRGQCIEHYGSGEAYLPVLEALEQLCRAPEGGDIIDLLVRQAPTWMVQMPWLLTAADLDRLQRTVLGATRQRMLREMARALEVLTAERPLVLVLEDMHWSDYATLDLLAVLARRQEPARLLVLSTYRPTEVLEQGHPLHTVTQELRLHGSCQELPLTLLSEAAVGAYLAARLPGTPHLDKIARCIHQRTEGNPLFMVTMVDEVMAPDGLREPAGAQDLLSRFAAAERGIPASLRQLLEHRLDQLSHEEQCVLEVGSVVGVDFAAAVVAAACDAEVEHVETWCEGLARRGRWLRSRGQDTWPDGTVSARYGFIHALYREVVYRRVTVTRRLRLHRRVAERLETGFGEQARTLAAELAVHFEHGRVYQRAVPYRGQAAENANQRCAYQEATEHLTAGLTLLETLPHTAERAQHELRLLTTLASVWRNTKGQAAPEVRETYGRAYALCQQIEDAPQLFPVLRGLWNYHNNRAELHTADEIGKQFFSLAQRQDDPTLLLWGHCLLGMGDQYYRGAFASAQRHFAQALALYDRPQHHSLAFLYGQDPGVIALSFLAWTSWLLGYPDHALQKMHAALTLAQELAHPYSLAAVLNWAAMLHQFRRESHTVRERAEAILALASEYGFAQRSAWGEILRGWALAEQGQAAEGIRQLHQGLAALHATGQELWRPYNLALLAEASGKSGRVAAGWRLLAEAQALVDQTGDCFWEPELYRLEGELLLGQAIPDDQQAEVSFQRALDLTRCRHAKSLELRAATSLARLWQRQGKRQAASDLLAPVYGWFTEGFETADVQEARTLLEEVSF